MFYHFIAFLGDEVRELTFRFGLDRYTGFAGLVFAEFVYPWLQGMVDGADQVTTTQPGEGKQDGQNTTQGGTNDTDTKKEERSSSSSTSSDSSENGDGEKWEKVEPMGEADSKESSSLNGNKERTGKTKSDAGAGKAKTSSTQSSSSSSSSPNSGGFSALHIDLFLSTLGITLIGAWYTYFGSLSNKYEYNKYHAYISWMPLVGYICLRNLSGKELFGVVLFPIFPLSSTLSKMRNGESSFSLRQYYSPALEKVGAQALELYVLQCHCLMCKNASHLLYFLPNAGLGYEADGVNKAAKHIFWSSWRDVPGVGKLVDAVGNVVGGSSVGDIFGEGSIGLLISNLAFEMENLTTSITKYISIESNRLYGFFFGPHSNIPTAFIGVIELFGRTFQALNLQRIAPYLMNCLISGVLLYLVAEGARSITSDLAEEVMWILFDRGNGGGKGKEGGNNGNGTTTSTSTKGNSTIPPPSTMGPNAAQGADGTVFDTTSNTGRNTDKGKKIHSEKTFVGKSSGNPNGQQDVKGMISELHNLLDLGEEAEEMDRWASEKGREELS